MTSVADAIVEVLARSGVTRAYTVPGESFLGVLDALERHPGIGLVSTRHESGAGFMAEGDAKITGLPAVALATRGVGAANLAIAVHTAYQDSTPLLVLLGQVESTFIGREAFQEVDLAAFYAPITKWAATATRGDRLPELVARGLRIARSGRPGPVMIAIPADLLLEPAAEPLTAASSAALPPLPPSPTVEIDIAEEISRQLADAERPVVIAGGGAQHARSELIALVERYQLGLYASFRRQDVFPNSHPNYLGHLGLGAGPALLEALRDADLLLVAGARLSEVTTQGYTLPSPRTRVIQIDIDPAVPGAVVPVAIPVVGDTATVLRAVLSRPVPVVHARSWGAAHEQFEAFSALPPTRAAEAGFVDPVEVIRAMIDVVPADAVVVNDAGNFSAFLHRHWRYDAPLTQVAPTSGAMGYGVPAGIGAKLAVGDRPVVVIAGDGGFLMTGQELETAVRCGIALSVIVFNNALYGTIAMHQAGASGRLAAVGIGSVDIAAYARSLGADGRRVCKRDEIAPAIAAALASGRVSIVEVLTDPDLIAPGRTLSGILAARA